MRRLPVTACGVSGGRDLKFSETRLEGYRNFMNKIWNATRFALGALHDFEKPADGVKAVPPKIDMTVADHWIISRTAYVTKHVEGFLEENRFQEAANLLYTFVWNEFCDWYLEFSKPIIYGEPSSERTATQLVLAQTLNRVMRLLHPMVPFITEEIYGKLPIHTGHCVTAEYPTIRNDKEWLSCYSEDAAAEMEIVKEVILAIRNIRGENQIKPGVGIEVRLSPGDDRVQKILGENRAVIVRMGKIEKCDIEVQTNFAKCAVSPVRVKDYAVDVIIPLTGLVDIDEEIKRLQKNIEKSQKDLRIVSGKLENESYIKNAPEELVIEDRALLEKIKMQITRMQESLNRLM